MGRRKMVETSKDYCRECKYGMRGSNPNAPVCCGYILKTLKRRNCPVGKCNKFEQRTEEEREDEEWVET